VSLSDSSFCSLLWVFSPRLALKARIHSKDDLGKALEVAYRQLKTHIETQQADLDNDIKARRILVDLFRLSDSTR
jgi:hypothetical protein